MSVSFSAPIPPEPSHPWQGKRGQLLAASWSVASTVRATHDAAHRPSSSVRATATLVADYLVMAAVSIVLIYLWMQ
jgi:hypothetical protein